MLLLVCISFPPSVKPWHVLIFAHVACNMSCKEVKVKVKVQVLSLDPKLALTTLQFFTMEVAIFILCSIPSIDFFAGHTYILLWGGSYVLWLFSMVLLLHVMCVLYCHVMYVTRWLFNLCYIFQGGYFIWIELPEGSKAIEVVQQCVKEYNVKVLPGAM